VASARAAREYAQDEGDDEREPVTASRRRLGGDFARLSGAPEVLALADEAEQDVLGAQ
jgi:hypothetical protein